VKLPRISVGAVMFGLIVVAVDCVVYRSIKARPDHMAGPLQPFVLATLPMANLLSFDVPSLIRCRAEGLGSRGGFVLGACLSLVATIFGLTPAIDGIESLLISAGLAPWLMASPIRELVLFYGILVVLPLTFQVGVGLMGRQIGRMIGGRRTRGRIETSRPARFRIVPLAMTILLAAIPALTVEGFLRGQDDPAIGRLEINSEAVVDCKATPYLPSTLPKNSTIPKLAGVRVRVGADREDFMIQMMVLQVAKSKEMRRYSQDLRKVQVTMLDGPRAGETIGINRCFLRPIR
jgi:hypothetical protein